MSKSGALKSLFLAGFIVCLLYCVKSLSFGFDFVESQDLITRPLVRNAAGKLEPATWEQAMQTRMHHSNEAARAQYRASFEPNSFETLFAGEVAADLLQLRRG